MTAISVCTAAPGSPEWLAERRNGIGASEVATLLTDNHGDWLNPWKSPYELWLEKTRQVEGFTGNYASRRGQHMEAFVLNAYGDAHPGHIIETAPDDIPSIMAHPDHPELRCSLDALVHNQDESIVVEIKAITRRQAYAWAQNNVPDYYLAQVQYQLLVTGLDVAHIAVDVAGEYEERLVERNDAMCAHMQDTVAQWWQTHIVEGVEPDLEPTIKPDRERMAKHWLAHTSDSAPPVVLDATLVARLRDARAALNDAKTEWDIAAATVQAEMREAVTAVDSAGDRIATWSPRKGATTIDKAALKADGLLEKYQLTGEPGRTFRVKG